jgi:hypothetical protein
LLLRLSIVSGLMLQTDLWIKSSAIGKTRVVKSRDSFIRGCVCMDWTSQIMVKLPWVSEFQQIEFIERIDTSDVPPNDIRSILFHSSKSTGPNRHKAERRDNHQVLAASTCFHTHKNITNGYWTLQQHQKGMGHVSAKDRLTE